MLGLERDRKQRTKTQTHAMEQDTMRKQDTMKRRHGITREATFWGRLYPGAGTRPEFRIFTYDPWAGDSHLGIPSLSLPVPRIGIRIIPYSVGSTVPGVLLDSTKNSCGNSELSQGQEDEPGT